MWTTRGSLISDTDGTRQATLFIPPGVQVSLSEAPGITAAGPGQAEPPRRKTPLSSLNLRLTEYTVGANGEPAMVVQKRPTIQVS